MATTCTIVQCTRKSDTSAFPFFVSYVFTPFIVFEFFCIQVFWFSHKWKDNSPLSDKYCLQNGCPFHTTENYLCRIISWSSINIYISREWQLRIHVVCVFISTIRNECWEIVMQLATNKCRSAYLLISFPLLGWTILNYLLYYIRRSVWQWRWWSETESNVHNI